MGEGEGQEKCWSVPLLGKEEIFSAGVESTPAVNMEVILTADIQS